MTTTYTTDNTITTHHQAMKTHTHTNIIAGGTQAPSAAMINGCKNKHGDAELHDKTKSAFEYEYQIKPRGSVRAADTSPVGGDGTCWKKAFRHACSLETIDLMASWTNAMVDIQTFITVYRRLSIAFGKPQMMDNFFFMTMNDSGVAHLVSVYTPSQFEELVESRKLEGIRKSAIRASSLYNPQSGINADIMYVKEAAVEKRDAAGKRYKVKTRPQLKMKLSRHGTPTPDPGVYQDILRWNGYELEEEEWIMLAMLNSNSMKDLRSINSFDELQTHLEMLSELTEISMETLTDSLLDYEVGSTLLERFGITVSVVDNNIAISNRDRSVTVRVPVEAMLEHTGANRLEMYHILNFCYAADGYTVIEPENLLGGISILEQISRDYNVPLSLINNTQLGNTLLETINKVANISVRQNDGKAIEVPETMPEEAFNEISRDFGRFNIVRVNNGNHPHPFHHASRRAVTKMIVSRYPRSDLLYDLGGDFNYHISKDNFHVHSVFKTDNPTDEARYINLSTKEVKSINNRLASLADRQGSQSVAIESVLNTIKSKDNVMWCNNSAGHCNHAPSNKLSFGMSVDTLFHIKPEELIKFYLHNNVVMSTHAMTVPKDYKIKAKGNLKYDEGVWTVSDGNLDIVFAGDSTVYSQEVEVLDTYMFQPLIATNRHVMYTRIQGYKGAHLILEHFMLERSIVDNLIFKHAKWINYNYDVVAVRIPKILLDKPTSLLDREPLDFETEQINIRFYERLLNRMMQPYSWESLKSYAASNVGRSYMTSAGIEQVWKMNNKSVMAHCIVAYWAMNRQVESMMPLVHRAEERARPTGFFQQLWKVLKNILVDIGNEFDPTTISEVQNFFSENATDDLQLVQLFSTLNSQIESLNVANQLSASHNIIDSVLTTLPIDVEVNWTDIDTWRENHDDSNRKTVVDLVVTRGEMPTLKTTCSAHHQCPHNHFKPHGHITFSPSVMPLGLCACCKIDSNVFPDGTCLLCTGHEQCSGYKTTCKHTHKLLNEECCGRPVCTCVLKNTCECCGKKSKDLYCRLCKPDPSTRPKKTTVSRAKFDDEQMVDHRNQGNFDDAPLFDMDGSNILDEESDGAVSITCQQEPQHVDKPTTEDDTVKNATDAISKVDVVTQDLSRQDTQPDGGSGNQHDGDKTHYSPPPQHEDETPTKVDPETSATADKQPTPAIGKTSPGDVSNTKLGQPSMTTATEPTTKLHEDIDRGESILNTIREVTGETSTTYTLHEAMSVGVRRPTFAHKLESGFSSFKLPNYRYKRVNHVDVTITSIGTSLDDGTCGASSLSQISNTPVDAVKEWLKSAVGSAEWSSETDLASFAIASSMNVVICTSDAAHLYMNNTSGIAHAITTTEPLDGNQHWVPCTLEVSLYYSSFVTQELATYYKLLRHLETGGHAEQDWNMVTNYKLRLSDAAAAYTLRGQSWDTILKLFHTSQVTDDGVVHKSEFYSSTNISDYIIKRPSGLSMIIAPTGFGKTTQLHTLHKDSTKLLILTPTRANVKSYVQLMQSKKITVAGRAESTWFPDDSAIKNPGKVRIIVMTVNAAFSALCGELPNANYLRLIAGRKIYFDEFHMVTPEYFTLCSRLGNLVSGVMTATPYGAMFDVTTRHPITSRWQSDEAMTLLLESYYEDGVHDGELLVVKSKQLAYHTASISDKPCASITSETVGQLNLSNCHKAVATNCVTNGVTMPHIKTVIDSGERIILNMKPHINYDSRRVHFFDVVTVRYSVNEMIQSRGRAGRTQPGHFIGPVPSDDNQVSVQDQLLMSLMVGVECSNYCHALFDYISDKTISHANDFIAVNKDSTDTNVLYDVENARSWVETAKLVLTQKKLGKVPVFVDESLTTQFYYDQMVRLLENEGTLSNVGVLKTQRKRPTPVAPAMNLELIKRHITQNCGNRINESQLRNNDKNMFIINMKTKPISWTDDTAGKNLADTVIEILINDYLTGLNTMIVMYKKMLRLENMDGASQGSQLTTMDASKWKKKTLFSFKPNDNQPVLIVDKTTKAATIMTYGMMSNISDGTAIITTNRDLSHMLVSITRVPASVTVARLKLVMSRSQLITGPPGSGKTYKAINDCKPDKFVSKQSLMLVKYGWETPNTVLECSKLGIDEIAMFNVYELLVMAQLADEFVMTGDVNQKVIDDDGLLTARNMDSSKLFDMLNLAKKTVLTRTWRFGHDTLNLLTKIGHNYQANDPAKSEIIASRNIHGKFGDKLRQAVHEASPTLIVCPTNDVLLWLRREGIHGTAATTTSRSQGFESERVMYLMLGQPNSTYTQSELYVAFTRHTKELYIITDNTSQALLQSKGISYPDFTHWDEYDPSRAGCVNISKWRSGLLGQIEGALLMIPSTIDDTIEKWRSESNETHERGLDPYYFTEGQVNDYTYALSSIASFTNGTVYERNNVTASDLLLVDTLLVQLRLSRRSNLQPHQLYTRIKQKQLKLPSNLMFEIKCEKPNGGIYYKRYVISENNMRYVGTSKHCFTGKGNICYTSYDTLTYTLGVAKDRVHLKERLVTLLDAIKASCVALYDLLCEYFGFKSHGVSPTVLAASMIESSNYMPRAWLDASSLAMACDGHKGLYGTWHTKVESFVTAGMNGAEAYEVIRQAAATQGKFLPSAPVDMHELHLNARVVPYSKASKLDYFLNAEGKPVRLVNMTLREAYSALKANTYDPSNYRSGYADVRDIIILRMVNMINDASNIREQVSLLVDEVLLVVDEKFKDRCEIVDSDRFGTRIGKSMRAVMIHKLLRTARGSTLYAVDENAFIESQVDESQDNEVDERAGGINVKITDLLLIIDSIKQWVCESVLKWCEWAADEEDGKSAASSGETMFHDTQEIIDSAGDRKRGIDLFQCCQGNVNIGKGTNDKMHENSNLVNYVELMLKCDNCPERNKIAALTRLFEVEGCDVKSNLNFSSFKPTSGMFKTVTVNEEIKQVIVKVVGLPEVKMHQLANMIVIVVDKVALLAVKSGDHYTLYWSDHNVMTNETLIEKAMKVLGSVAGGSNDVMKLLRRSVIALIKYIRIRKDIFVWTTKAALGVCHTMTLHYNRSAKSCYFSLLNDKYFQRTLKLNSRNKLWLQGNALVYSRRSSATVLDCHTMMFGVSGPDGVTLHLYAGREERLKVFSEHVQHALGTDKRFYNAGKTADGLRRLGINIQANLNTIDKDSWLAIVKQAAQTNPLANLANISTENSHKSYEKIMDDIIEHKRLTAISEQAPTILATKMAICIPSGHGKTTTVQRIKRELPHMNVWDIDDILTTPNVIRMWEYNAALLEYKSAFMSFDETHEKPYLMLCHHPSVVPKNVKTLIIINDKANVPAERIWSSQNVESLVKHSGASISRVNGYDELYKCVVKYYASGCDNQITMTDNGEIVDAIDDFGGYSFFQNNTGPDTLMFAPADGNISVPNFAESLGYQRVYKTGRHVGVSRPTIQKLTTSTFNAISTRLHGIQKLRTEHITSDEYFNALSTLFKGGWENQMEEFRNEPISLSYDDSLKWLINKGHKIELLSNMAENTTIGELSTDPTRATAHFKVENLLKEEVNDMLDQKGRVIVWNNQNINMFLCPMINECKRRLKMLLNDKLVTYADGMTMTDINNKLSTIKKTKYLVELDLSKQDRQTDRPILNFEYKLLARLGLDGEIVAYLQQLDEGFTYTTPEKIKSRRPPIRWTGGAMTSLGNEIRNLLLIADLIPDKNIEHIWTLGDDSLIMTNTEFDEHQTQLISTQRHNVVCTFSQSEKAGLFLQLIVCWIDDTYIATHNFDRLREKLTYSPYPVWSESWKSKYASFLMMIGDTPDVRYQLMRLGYKSLPPLGTSFEQRLFANATYHNIEPEDILLIINDIIASSSTESTELILPLTMIAPRNKLLSGEIPLYEYQEVKVNTASQINQILEAVSGNYY
nr:polyprotein [Setosphaeria turcica endornavirus 1]